MSTFYMGVDSHSGESSTMDFGLRLVVYEQPKTVTEAQIHGSLCCALSYGHSCFLKSSF